MAHRGWAVAAAALAALSIATTLVTEPLQQTGDALARAAPWIGGGLLLGEAAWIGGAVIMLGAVGAALGNPLRIRAKMRGIAARANGSRWFRIGFWVNTSGAVLEFVVTAVGVCWYLPPQSWGVLVVGLVDLAATIALRKLIWDGTRRRPPHAPLTPPEPRPLSEAVACRSGAASTPSRGRGPARPPAPRSGTPRW